MNNLNSILVEGNMVREPVYRTTPKGTPVCNFRLASNRFYIQDSGVEKEVSFFDIETWTKLAEACNSLGRKGRGVRVVGRLKEDRWTDNEGKHHSRIKIIADHVEFRPEFKKDTAYETDANAESDGEDIAAAIRQYHEDAKHVEYHESQVMANVPASVMF